MAHETQKPAKIAKGVSHPITADTAVALAAAVAVPPDTPRFRRCIPLFSAYDLAAALAISFTFNSSPGYC